MSFLLLGIVVQLAVGEPCSVLEDPVEVAVLGATGLLSRGLTALNCATKGMLCDNDTFDGKCRVVAVPSDRGLQLWCDSGTQISDVISLPALGAINATTDAAGAFGVYGCNAQTISFPRLQMVHAVDYNAFRIATAPNLVAVEFPMLKSISGGGGLMISGAPRLKDAQFPALLSIDSLADGIYISGETQLQQLAFPVLRQVSLLGTKGISIIGHPLLQSVVFASLKKVAAGQAITIVDNDALTTLSFPALTSVQAKYGSIGYGFRLLFSSQRVCVDLHNLQEFAQSTLSEYVPAHEQDDAFLMLSSFASSNYWSSTFNDLPNVTHTNWCPAPSRT